jgi:hypothetical protein
MADVGDADPGGAVDIRLAGLVPDRGTLAAHQREVALGVDLECVGFLDICVTH